MTKFAVKKPGLDKASLRALPVIRDRLTFLYVEHCIINRQDGALTISDARGTAYVPSASISVLMLGPGTNITHRAIQLISNTGTAVLWTGEWGVRLYAYGRPLSSSTRLLLQQASLVLDDEKRLAVAKKMYQMRFPNEQVDGLTLQQLRGKEGARVRNLYRRMASLYKVEWTKRNYDFADFASGDDINKALSVANACLYGVVKCVIMALGCSSGLGFIHTGHDNSFVYDIADLYKAQTSIPVSFEIVSNQSSNLETDVRKAMRDSFKTGRILKQVTADICNLLDAKEELGLDIEADVLYLWDDKTGSVARGISYGKFNIGEDDGNENIEIEQGE